MVIKIDVLNLHCVFTKNENKNEKANPYVHSDPV